MFFVMFMNVFLILFPRFMPVFWTFSFLISFVFIILRRFLTWFRTVFTVFACFVHSSSYWFARFRTCTCCIIRGIFIMRIGFTTCIILVICLMSIAGFATCILPVIFLMSISGLVTFGCRLFDRSIILFLYKVWPQFCFTHAE
uniref:Uncharacterized protein n=1 Tax=Cacopsylla melanoneura TaxID=428564 RepID=A0A8D8PLN8_9HEMI